MWHAAPCAACCLQRIRGETQNPARAGAPTCRPVGAGVDVDGIGDLAGAWAGQRAFRPPVLSCLLRDRVGQCPSRSQAPPPEASWPLLQQYMLERKNGRWGLSHWALERAQCTAKQGAARLPARPPCTHRVERQALVVQKLHRGPGVAGEAALEEREHHLPAGQAPHLLGGRVG